MNFTDYIESKRHTSVNKKIPQEIKERWNTRIVRRSLHTLGRSGAIQYLADYGKGIAVPKVINLALMAESENCHEMAQGFWAKAFELETGQKALREDKEEGFERTNGSLTPAQNLDYPTLNIISTPVVPELPPALQPGQILTMQAVDAPHERFYYINNPGYWGQPKRDGNRVVVIATPSRIFYQSRSTRLRDVPTMEIEQALLAVVAKLGTFVLDGELYYRSAIGSEHRTGAQAATINIESGHSTKPPQTVYAIFSSLFINKRDLTSANQAERIDAGVVIGSLLESLSKEFEIIPTARTPEEKLLLTHKQQAQNREGEIWVQSNCNYTGGKDARRLPIVRTKYCQELDVIVIRLTPTTAEGRPFGAIEVAKEVEGRLLPVGSVGAGFGLSDMQEIARRHTLTPNQVKITVRSQGLTEGGQLWHGRFLELCP